MRNLILMATAVLLAACTGGDNGALLGTLERDRVDLVAESQQPIIEVKVREGDHVTRGQLLMRLDPTAIDTSLQKARAAVAQARGVLAERVTGPRREQVLAASARLAGAEARLAAASRDFDRVRDLVARQMLPQSNLDQSRAARDSAQAERDADHQQLLELQRGTRSEEVEQAQAALQQAEAQVAELEVSRGRLDVTAPRDGVIDALPYKLGERPPAGAPVVIMLADGVPYARVFVPEPLRARVKAGDSATVRFDGSDHDWHGRVRFVSTDAAFTPYYALNERDRSRLSFLALVDLTDAEARSLPTGMPVQVLLQATGAGQ